MLRGITHVVLYCRDTEAALRWYETVGFRRVRGYDGMYWLAVGDVEVMLHPSDEGPSGAVPELYVSVDDVDALLGTLRDRGLQPVHHQADGPLTEPVTTPWGARELELYDPDGHRWGFVQA